MDVILVRPFVEAYPRNVLPLWLCFCGSFHPFSAWCGIHDLPCTRACHGVLHRSPWPSHCVICKALTSHRGLARDWWVKFGLCVTLDQWHAVWVSLASWLRFCVTLGSWCKVVCCEPDMFYVPWWLPHPGVQCQGLLRWLAHAARTYGFGSFGPCPGWGYSAHLWFSFLVTWCASFHSLVACGYCIACHASLLAVSFYMTCLAPVLAMVCSIDLLGFVIVWRARRSPPTVACPAIGG
ncbi:hypothetical protein V6N13_116061 [Hibiscus sabdariffa]